MIRLEVWLYGPMAEFVADNPHKQSGPGYALLNLEMPLGSTMRDLLQRLRLPQDKKGITIVNGQLTDMPNLAADRDLELHDGDRVAFFHERSMWPFQYRFGASTNTGLTEALQRRGFLRHSSRDHDAE